MTNPRTIGMAGLVFFTATVRLLPHAPNMTPLSAIALVGGMYLGARYAYLLPVFTLAATDIIIGAYDWRIMASVYLSFLLIGYLGAQSGGGKDIAARVSFVLGSSLIFFLITNGAVWIFSPWYEHSFAGLLYCYELGLPFLRNMLVGDIGYTVSIVAVLELTLSAYTHLTSLRVHIINKLSDT